jgi:predicted AlkP superfamily pyrophosphatase or phosphodiesterase
MENGFIHPRYDEGGFASLPKRLNNLLTGSGKNEVVVLFLIDGFGWRFFEKFQQEPFLKSVTRVGQVERLTAQFPSTTAAHITTLHTGKTVGEHGIFEWIYYEPALDAIIAPLLFSFAGTFQRDTLKQVGVKPSQLYPNSTFYHSLKKLGVSATIFQHREYTPSSFSDVIFSGAKSIGYKTLPEALVNLTDALSQSTSASYYVLYNEKIDAICHEYGPDSVQTTAEIQTFLLIMESIFQKALKGNRKRIRLLLTADHGQVETDPLKTVYLNREARFAGIEKFLRRNRQGELLVPGGSARDFFLYIQAGMVEDALRFLTIRLEGQAEVRKVADLMSEGYFGPVLSRKFCARVGDLVILPFRNESVWWYEKSKHEHRYHGHHGGLTAQEMEIPLLTWEM